MTTTKRRWTIVYPETRQYTADATGRTNKIGCTEDLRFARMLCSKGGVVVDADWLSANWPVIARGEPIPAEALPPEEES